jgi:hypothetical protein
LTAIAATAGLVIGESAAITSTRAAPPPHDLLSYLDRYVKLPDEAKARLLAGEAVSVPLDSDPSSEIAVFGAVWIDAPMSRYLAAVRDIEHLESGSAFRVTHKISQPPRLDDFAALTLPDRDTRDAQWCRVARCGLKLTSDGIERMQRDVDWTRPDAGDQVDRFARRFMFDYVNGYLAGGNARLAVYHDAERPIAIAQEFTSLVSRVPALDDLFPDVRRYLLEFPAAPLPGGESFLYWQETKFGLKPTIRINHVVIAERPNAAIIVSKLIYATHYVRGALEVRILLPDPARGRGFWLLAEYRMRPDGLSGMSGRMIRGRVHGDTERGTVALLQSTKTRLEAR